MADVGPPISGPPKYQVSMCIGSWWTAITPPRFSDFNGTWLCPHRFVLPCSLENGWKWGMPNSNGLSGLSLFATWQSWQFWSIHHVSMFKAYSHHGKTRSRCSSDTSPFVAVCSCKFPGCWFHSFMFSHSWDDSQWLQVFRLKPPIGVKELTPSSGLSRHSCCRKKKNCWCPQGFVEHLPMSMISGIFRACEPWEIPWNTPIPSCWTGWFSMGYHNPY